ncbi:MAG: methylenetetrahydrofolate reductase [Treponema sp.]|jgi:methylenetetrahydrofolate reductase (NADPH)|nr:methylenetetrahydrofolate reductase [Treponema sp.]
MKITEILKMRMGFSFEVFPPKNEQPMEPLFETLAKLYDFKPDFISCTYGAGGTNKGRSLEICKAVKQSGHEVVVHFTCIGNTRADVKAFVAEYIALGIENFLMLRGDFPVGWNGTHGDFAHADELTAFICGEFPDLHIGVAGYPEKHIDALSFDEDIAHLRSKQNNGAQFIMLQLCHDIVAYQRYVERVRRAGIHIPIIVGLMPVLARDPIIRMTVSNGCSIPAELANILGKYPDDADSFQKAGMEYTVKQIHRYIAAGIDGLHIFTINKWRNISKILKTSGIRITN